MAKKKTLTGICFIGVKDRLEKVYVNINIYLLNLVLCPNNPVKWRGGKF